MEHADINSRHPDNSSITMDKPGNNRRVAKGFAADTVINVAGYEVGELHSIQHIFYYVVLCPQTDSPCYFI